MNDCTVKICLVQVGYLHLWKFVVTEEEVLSMQVNWWSETLVGVEIGRGKNNKENGWLVHCQRCKILIE